MTWRCPDCKVLLWEKGEHICDFGWIDEVIAEEE